MHPGADWRCEGMNVNFAFSSPPYFNLEKYCEEDTQCYNKFTQYDEWVEKYWRKTVVNVKNTLVDDGVFAINVGGMANKIVIKIKEDLNKVIREEGFVLIDEWYMKTSKSHLSAKKGTGDKLPCNPSIRDDSQFPL